MPGRSDGADAQPSTRPRRGGLAAALVEQAPHAVLVEQAGRIVFANPPAMALLGLSGGPAEFPEGLPSAVAEAIAACESAGAPVAIAWPGGGHRRRQLVAELRPLRWDGGSGRQLLLRRPGPLERPGARRCGATIDLLPDAVLVLSAQRIVLANPQALALLGGGTDRPLEGVRLRDLLPAAERAAVLRRLARLGRTGRVFGPLDLRLRDLAGRTIDLELRGAGYREASGWFVQLVLRDIGERKALEERLRFLAQHDPLTGLPNRMLFDDRLRQAVMRARRQACHFTLMLLDLDDFKEINDGLGHGAGDEVLRSLSARLRGALRATDTLARLGGDEFAIICEGVHSAAGLEPVARRLTHEVARPARFGARQLRVTASIGAAFFPVHGEEPDDLVRHADLALYAAKQVEGSCHRVFDFGLHIRAPEVASSAA
jgi:diguanylate cyclase (GGDEF)-like protein